MKNQPPIALVAEGPAKDFPLALLPGLLARLGAVKSSSSRIASRVVNTLRAGFPIAAYKELDAFPDLMLSVGSSLPRVITELCASGLAWRGRTVLVCGNTSGSSDLPALAAMGAAVGSVDIVSMFAPPRFIAEGDPQAVRLARTLVAIKEDMLEITKASKALYSSGMTIAGSFVVPTAAAGVQCLRMAGMPLRDAMLIVEKTIAGSLRAFVKAGDKGWTGPLATGNLDAVEKQLEELHQSNPLLERYFRQNGLLALEMFSRNPGERVKKMARLLEGPSINAAAAGS